MKAETPIFQFEKYQFEKAFLDFASIHTDKNLISIDFDPSGIYKQAEQVYSLTLKIDVFSEYEEEKKLFVSATVIATFKFNGNIEFKTIPDFFYPNSIAIIYPYIRSFVSTLTLQANIKPLILPTFNLSSLQNKLRNSTRVE